jgi:DNA modification methylase
LITTIFDNFGYCKEMFIWGADYFYKHIPNFDKGHYLVWDKTLTSNGDADSNSEYELLWTKEKHKRQVLHFNWFRYFGLSKQDGGKRIHPTQKPLQVLTPIIKEYSKQDDMVLDLFGGSGSTLIACEQTNRTCYMMELDPKYCDVIRKRYAKLIDKEDQWQTITPKI